MDFRYKIDYYKFSDRQIVERILAEPHDDEAAAYLLYNRYNPLLRNVYWSLINDDSWFNDCVIELFMHLKGKDGSWHTLACFEWRSTFGFWLEKVSLNKFRAILPKLIENRGRNISIDDSNSERTKIHIPVYDQDSYERSQQKVMVLEAVSKLKDDDQRFVILKRLQGYNSREIAILLQKRWIKHGIKKYNNKKELVVPDAAYIDVRTQRAKENLKQIIIEL